MPDTPPELGWKGTLPVREQALALFGAAGDLRQGDEQLRGCIGGIAFRRRHTQDDGQQGFRAARGCQQIFAGGLPGGWLGRGPRFVPCRAPMPVSTGTTVLATRCASFVNAARCSRRQFAEGAPVVGGHLVFGRGGKLLGQAAQRIGARHRRIGPIQNRTAEALELRPATEAFFNSRRVG